MFHSPLNINLNDLNLWAPVRLADALQTQLSRLDEIEDEISLRNELFIIEHECTGSSTDCVNSIQLYFILGKNEI